MSLVVWHFRGMIPAYKLHCDVNDRYKEQNSQIWCCSIEFLEFQIKFPWLVSFIKKCFQASKSLFQISSYFSAYVFMSLCEILEEKVLHVSWGHGKYEVENVGLLSAEISQDGRLCSRVSDDCLKDHFWVFRHGFHHFASLHDLFVQALVNPLQFERHTRVSLLQLLLQVGDDPSLKVRGLDQRH